MSTQQEIERLAAEVDVLTSELNDKRCLLESKKQELVTAIAGQHNIRVGTRVRRKDAGLRGPVFADFEISKIMLGCGYRSILLFGRRIKKNGKVGKNKSELFVEDLTVISQPEEGRQ